jgi:hypothetical protein
LSISGSPVRRHAEIDPKEDTMRYALLIYGTEDAWERLSDAERQERTKVYMALGEDPRTVGGAELQSASTATVVRVDDGERLTTDGPFAETKEQLGGFYLVEADNLDEALEFAARIPAASGGGAVEVRPLVERN